MNLFSYEVDDLTSQVMPTNKLYALYCYYFKAHTGFRIVGAGCRMMVLTGVTSLCCIYQKMVTNVKHKARFRGTNDDVLT